MKTYARLENHNDLNLTYVLPAPDFAAIPGRFTAEKAARCHVFVLSGQYILSL